MSSETKPITNASSMLPKRGSVLGKCKNFHLLIFQMVMKTSILAMEMETQTSKLFQFEIPVFALHFLFRFCFFLQMKTEVNFSKQTKSK